ncbi:MAG TPA: succinate dehydrogenase, hydrophobic membrane anchor protein [Alphaproteobacteria bacterium]|nr:succinate dehydrogenase, hydrophobic membrane anchor protein [Alphaproteobacteria bacterium]
MIDRRTIADPRARYGSARRATGAFKWQRITGALNVLFLAFLVWLVVNVAGAERAAFVATLANPLVALLLGLLLINVCAHMRIGMREIIEDYVHDPRLHRLALGVNDIFVLLVGLVGLAALSKIVFWG